MDYLIYFTLILFIHKNVDVIELVLDVGRSVDGLGHRWSRLFEFVRDFGGSVLVVSGFFEVRIDFGLLFKIKLLRFLTGIIFRFNRGFCEGAHTLQLFLLIFGRKIDGWKLVGVFRRAAGQGVHGKTF